MIWLCLRRQQAADAIPQLQQSPGYNLLCQELPGMPVPEPNGVAETLQHTLHILVELPI